LGTFALLRLGLSNAHLPRPATPESKGKGSTSKERRQCRSVVHTILSSQPIAVWAVQQAGRRSLPGPRDGGCQLAASRCCHRIPLPLPLPLGQEPPKEEAVQRMKRP
jgi:hypothetical protein